MTMFQFSTLLKRTIPLLKASRSYFTLPVPKRLEEVVKLPLFKRESPETLQKLWFEQFQERADVAVDVIFQSEWKQMRQNILHSPQFVIPVFKDFKQTTGTPTSYFNLFVQFQEGQLGLMTSVDAFRNSPTGSPPFAILTIFDELADSKGILFVRCDALAKQQLSKYDLTYCWDYLRAFYSDPTLYRECVEKFNHRSRDFDFREFMDRTGPVRQQIYQGAKIQAAAVSGKGPKEFVF